MRHPFHRAHTTGASPAVSCQQIHLQPILWKADWNLPFYTWGTEDLGAGRGLVFTVTGRFDQWTPLHRNQDPPCLRLQGRADGSTMDKRRWRETWVCIAGIQSWGRGRNGNAESVKLHESPGEGGNGYTAVGKGKGAVTDRVRCAVWCFVIPFITYLWTLTWQLSSISAWGRNTSQGF